MHRTSPHAQQPHSQMGLHEELHHLQAANDATITKLQDILQINQHWKDSTIAHLAKTVELLAEPYERVLNHSYDQLVEVRKRIECAYRQIDHNLGDVATEIDSIHTILNSSDIISHIQSLDPPFRKSLELVDSHAEESLKNSRSCTFYRTRTTRMEQQSINQQKCYEVLFMKLTGDYNKLSGEYFELVHRIVNFEEQTLINEILTDDKVETLRIAYKTKVEREQQESLMRGLKERKRNLAKISSLLLTDSASEIPTITLQLEGS